MDWLPIRLSITSGPVASRAQLISAVTATTITVDGGSGKDLPGLNTSMQTSNTSIRILFWGSDLPRQITAPDIPGLMAAGTLRTITAAAAPREVHVLRFQGTVIAGTHYADVAVVPASGQVQLFSGADLAQRNLTSADAFLTIQGAGTDDPVNALSLQFGPWQSSSVTPTDDLTAAVAGDLNGNGLDDLLLSNRAFVTKSTLNPIYPGNDLGRVYVFAGSASPPATLRRDDADLVITDEFLGAGLYGLGDVTGDGFGDFAVTRSREGATTAAGSVLVYTGSSDLATRQQLAQDLFRADFSSLTDWKLSNSNDTNGQLSVGQPGWHQSVYQQYSSTGGNHLWYGVLGGTDYNAPDAGVHSGTVVSPTIDLRGVTDDRKVSLSFNYLLHTDEIDGRDIAEVRVAIVDPVTGLPDAFTLIPTATNQPGGMLQDPTTSTPSNPWRRAEFLLSAWKGQQIQLQFSFDTVSGGLNNYRGWHIDDLAVQTVAYAHAISRPTLTGQPLTGFQFAEGPLTVQAGDYDNDGHIDLAVGETSRRVFLQSGSSQTTLGQSNQGQLFVFSHIASQSRELGLASATYQFQGETNQDRFGTLGNSRAGDLDGDGLIALVAGAATSDLNTQTLDTGKVYLLRGARVRLPAAQLPEDPTVLVASPLGDVVERSSDGRLLAQDDTLPIGQSVRWYQFTTAGDGQLGDFVRVTQVAGVSGAPYELKLYTQIGELVQWGIQPLLSLDRVVRGTYLLAVRLPDTATASTSRSFRLELATPARDYVMATLAPDRDLLDGGDGADYLDGGPGLDRLFGGEGTDTFVGEEFEFFDRDASLPESSFPVRTRDEAANSTSPLNQVVTITNTALRRAIAAALLVPRAVNGEPITPLTHGDLARLAELTVDSITDLTGLEAAVNLLQLSITNSTLASLSQLVRTLSPQLGGARYLTELTLSGSSVSDWTGLSSLQSLTRLDLSGTNFSNLSLLPADALLVRLDLSRTAVPVSGLFASLESYHQLTDLGLAGMGVTSAQLAGSGVLPQLEVLDLRNNNLRDISVLLTLSQSTLSHLKTVLLNSNPLNNAAFLTDISSLQAMGVTVEYDANQAPVWQPLPLQVTPTNMPLSVLLPVSDPEGAVLMLSAISDQTDVTVQVVGDSLRITPTNDFAGLVTVTLTATEPGTGSWGRSASTTMRVYVGVMLASGTAFVDGNADGVWSTSTESVLAGWTVYLDEDSDGVLDSGEPRTVTAADGHYELAWAMNQTGLVRLVAANASYSVPTAALIVSQHVPLPITINPGAADANPADFVTLAGRLFFSAEGSNGNELWMLSNPNGEPQAIRSLNSGTIPTTPTQLTNVGGRLFFVGTDPMNGRHLWVVNSDGTGLQQVASSGPMDPDQLASIDDRLFFSAINAASGRELWVVNSNGTGLAQLTEGLSAANTQTYNSNPRDLRLVGGRVYFTAEDAFGGRELSSVSATATSVGTAAIQNYDVGAAGVNPTISSTNVPQAIPDVSTLTSTLNVSGLVGVISDLNLTLNISHSYDGDLVVYLISPSGRRIELFTNIGNYGKDFTNTTFDDQASTAVASGLAPFTGSYQPAGQLSTVNGEDPNGVWTLEITDSAGENVGTLNSWSVLITTNPGGFGSTNAELTELDGILYFVANGRTGLGEEIFKLDPSTGLPVAIRTLTGGQTLSTPKSLTSSGGRLYFVATSASAGEELWRVDADGTGLTLVTTVPSGGADGAPGDLTAIGTHLFFSALDPIAGRQLWLLDTANSTPPVSVSSLNAGLLALNPAQMQNINGKLVFSATDAARGRELWTVNENGTSLTRLTDLVAGAGDSSPTSVAELGGRLVFAATTSDTGTELWTLTPTHLQGNGGPCRSSRCQRRLLRRP